MITIYESLANQRTLIGLLKTVKGTPYAEVQKELHKRGLHDPWMRKWYFSYDGIMRRPYTLVSKPPKYSLCNFETDRTQKG